MNIVKILETMSQIINIFDDNNLSTEEALAISNMISSIASQDYIGQIAISDSDMKTNRAVVLSFDEALLSEDH
jgi:hypothetical protein